MDETYLQEQIVILKAQIAAYNNAITSLATAGVASYTLDTGQSRQTVTKLDVDRLTVARDGLYNQLTVFYSLLNGTGTTIVRPGW